MLHAQVHFVGARPLPHPSRTRRSTGVSCTDRPKLALVDGPSSAVCSVKSGLKIVRSPFRSVHVRFTVADSALIGLPMDVQRHRFRSHIAGEASLDRRAAGPEHIPGSADARRQILPVDEGVAPLEPGFGNERVRRQHLLRPAGPHHVQAQAVIHVEAIQPPAILDARAPCPPSAVGLARGS